MADYIPVHRKTLQWIFDNTEDSDRTKEQRENLLEWMDDENRQPTFSEIRAASSDLGIPLGYFFLSEPPKEELPILKYRTADSEPDRKPSRELVDTYFKIVQIQDWVRNDRLVHDQDPLSFIASLDPSENFDQLVSQVCQLLQIPDRGFQHCRSVEEIYNLLKKKICDLGVTVISSGFVENNRRRPLDPEEFRAFALSDDLAPLIFINGQDSQAEMLFSLIHELICLLTGSSDLLNGQIRNIKETDKEEAFVTKAVMEILFLLLSINCDNLTVPEEVATIMDVAKEDSGKSEKEHGESEDLRKACSLDRNFLIALERSLCEGRTQYTEAYLLTDTTYGTFDDLMKQ